MASREQTASHLSNIAAASKLTNNTGNSPHFMISPRELGAYGEEGRDLVLVFDKDQRNKHPSFSNATILPTTNFEFPLHSAAIASLDELR